MNILEKVEENWLKNLKINNKNNYELEIRFTEITKEIYEIIYYEFYEKYTEFKISKSNILEKVIYDKNISYIQNNENKEYYKIKKRLKWLYLKNINANITLSIENDKYINNQEKNNYIKRKKERTSFIDIINNISYDFTIIDNDVYQMEIEFLNIKSNITDNIIKKIYDSIYNIIKILPLNIKKILRQPIPLKNVDDISEDFAVTEKLDGIRCILQIINNREIILIKNNFKIKIITNLKIKKETNDINNYNNTIIDGELINNNIFYAFDIIIFKGIFLKENLIQRIEKLKNMKFLSKKGKMDVYYKVKEYYYHDIIENSRLLLKKKKRKFQIDGLIFNSISQSYTDNIIYKWKYVITFDFMIKKVNNSDIWELYCYNGNNNYIIFPKNNNYKIKSDKNLEIKYQDGIIVEFKYENNVFFPLKIRTDKIRPNYIDVALDNWNCNINKILF